MAKHRGGFISGLLGRVFGVGERARKRKAAAAAEHVKAQQRGFAILRRFDDKQAAKDARAAKRRSRPAAPQRSIVAKIFSGEPEPQKHLGAAHKAAISARLRGNDNLADKISAGEIKPDELRELMRRGELRISNPDGRILIGGRS